VSALKKLLAEYIGGQLTLLGEIPEDPSMERAVRSFLPLAEYEPASPAAAALRAIAGRLANHVGEMAET
jgi:flagellar biosynthesis protein FlhG